MEQLACYQLALKTAEKGLTQLKAAELPQEAGYALRGARVILE